MPGCKNDVANKYFPNCLRSLMKNKYTTQEMLSMATGKTRQTISQYVNGISEPGFDTLVIIAKYFNVTTDYLLGLSDIPNPNTGVAREYYLKAAEKEKRMSNLAELLGIVSEEIREVLNATP